MASANSSAILDDISIFDQSSPESLRARPPSPQSHDHLNSTSDEQTSNADSQYDYITHKHSKISSNRSSISSFPGSVIHTIPFTDTEDIGPRTPSRSQSYDRAIKAPAPGYLSAFRNPSSVRALQLDSEWADSDSSSTGYNLHARRSPKLSRVGSRSPGSVYSSAAKRSSRPATPKLQSSKLKKEFPLVLLHCSLLPPAVTAHGPLVADEILQAVLPEKYRKRWKTLQDKVVKNNEVKQRGVLISHPREDYDILEERLLESLELERPRIRRGHFLGRKSADSDSGFESSSQNGSDEASDTEGKENLESHQICSDCGTAVSQKVEQDRHWEIKVFAANGLMKSGAWAAAWEEMEKVDVEVGIWMPEEVRTEVEERLKALQAMEEAERPIEPPVERKAKDKRTRRHTARSRHDERMREIYGGKTESNTQQSTEGPANLQSGEMEIQSELHDQSNSPPIIPESVTVHSDAQQEDFVSFMKRHARIICQDQRNLAIVLLSIFVLMFSFQNAKTPAQQSQNSPHNGTLQHPTSLRAVEPSVSYITETVFAAPIVTTSSDTASLSTAISQLSGIITETPLVESVLPDVDLEQPSSTHNFEVGYLETNGGSFDEICKNVQDIVLDRLRPSNFSCRRGGHDEQHVGQQDL